MSFLKFIGKVQEKMLNKSEEIAKKVGATQEQLQANPSEALTNFVKKKTLKETKPKPEINKKKSKTATAIINRFYADYPELPYISDSREKDWIESAEMFPKQYIIPKEMMTRFSNGLLPGHIYMLYWLKRYTNKKVPVYFEYKYGIDFEKEKLFLKNNGFLNDLDKPTEKGEKAIKDYYSVVEKHSPPKPDRSIEGISKQTLEQRDSIIKNGFKEYEFIANRDCCEKCAQLNGKHFPVKALKIGENAPPMHEGCRCSIAAYLDRREYDEWRDFIDKGGTNAQWEKMKKQQRKTK